MMILIRHTKRKGATETIETQRKDPAEFDIPKPVKMLMLDLCEEVTDKHRPPGIVDPAKTAWSVPFASFSSPNTRACLNSNVLVMALGQNKGGKSPMGVERQGEREVDCLSGSPEMVEVWSSQRHRVGSSRGKALRMPAHSNKGTTWPVRIMFPLGPCPHAFT